MATSTLRDTTTVEIVTETTATSPVTDLSSTEPSTTRTESTISTTTTTTTPSTTATTSSTTTTTRTTTTTIKNPCQNGAEYDGIKCICPDHLYGTYCELFTNRVEIGKIVNTTVKVELKISNRNYEELKDESSDKYKGFEKDFKEEMRLVYKDVKGYKDVNITAVKPGAGGTRYKTKVRRNLVEGWIRDIECGDSNCEAGNRAVKGGHKHDKPYSEDLLDVKNVREAHRGVHKSRDTMTRSENAGIIVEHEVIIETQYEEDKNVTVKYEEIFQQIEEKLESVNATDNCDSNASLCFTPGSIKPNKVTPPSEKEMCQRVFGELGEYYYPDFSSTGLSCISICDTKLDGYYNCNEGTCQLKQTGPQCYCPDTDKYIYGNSRCQGRILKAGLYGGVGGAIGFIFILIIAIVTLFHLRRKKRDRKADAFSKDEDTWYEEASDEEWKTQQGFRNLNGGEVGGEDNSKSSSFSGKEYFKPTLANVDTTIQVKIQRPTISSI
ncbi:mucin-3B-like isoform X1 [Spea bombifrons]|uniref:mucin-3B-like isoform X1 n=1 Tax=Spea bombifrons TaxID=233779 RepID=UPI00234B6A82|nr:mucin-3B-like isoform X1 [Spea bombifrons]